MGENYILLVAQRRTPLMNPFAVLLKLSCCLLISYELIEILRSFFFLKKEESSILILLGFSFQMMLEVSYRRRGRD